MYPVSEQCVIDTETYRFWQTPDITSYNFTEAKPFHNYSVAIAAATSVGYGAASNVELVQTEAAIPEPPVILDYHYEEYDLTDYNVIGVINFSVPCEVNGVLSHFRVTIEGSSTYDEEVEQDEQEIPDSGNFNFTYQHSLKAAFNYSFTIATVLSDTSLQSDDVEISFLAPDGCKNNYNFVIIDKLIVLSSRSRSANFK